MKCKIQSGEELVVHSFVLSPKIRVKETIIIKIVQYQSMAPKYSSPSLPNNSVLIREVSLGDRVQHMH